MDSTTPPARNPSSSPDIMNDPEFDTNKTTDKSASEADTCRICRSEGSPTEPLFYPCKCSGSIKFVHQDCLMEWLSHSHKKHCELCKTPFRFTKLYDSHMPHTLPLAIFLKRACIHTLRYILYWARAVVVSLIWLILLPWCIRWSWRGLFWTTDAGWARDSWLSKMENLTLQHSQANHTLHHAHVSAQPVALSLSRIILGALFNPWKPLPQPNRDSQQGAAVPPYSTFLSDFASVNSLTSSPWTNRFILDVLEGQIITFAVVVAFILIFLIREWVVQQQPIIHAAAQIQDAEIRLEVAERAVQHLHDLHDEEELAQDDAENRGRVRDEQLIDLAQDDAEDRGRARNEQPVDPSSESDTSEGQGDFIGWEAIETLMSHTGAPYEAEGQDHQLYLQAVEEAKKEFEEQIEVAREVGASDPDIALNLIVILEQLDPTEKALWSDYLSKTTLLSNPTLDDIDEYNNSFNTPDADEPVENDESSSGDRLQRPAMPPRDTSSHAQRVLQSIEEGGFDTDNGEGPSHAEEGRPSSRGSWQSISDSSDSGSTHTPVEAREYTQSASIAADDSAESANVDEAAHPKPESPETDRVSGGVAAEHTSNPDDSVPSARLDVDSQAPEPDTPAPRATATDDTNEPNNADRPGVQDVSSQEPAQENNQPHEVHPEEPPRGFVQRLFDWFWADIVPDGDNGQLPGIDEEVIIGDEADQPPFVHIHGGQPARPDPQPDGAQDPEVLQAAAEAGLDAEAIEDAEDLEGVLELIGMQGPLVGLMQTAMFCGVLITSTLWTAIGMPYLFGKLALVFLGNPVIFLIMVPLRIASILADAIVDSTIYICGAAAYFGAQVFSHLLLWCHPFLDVNPDFLDFLAKRAHTAANAAAGRISSSFSGEGPFETGFLMVSIQARQTLLSLKTDVAQVFGFVEWVVSSASHHLKNSTWSEILQVLFKSLKNELQAAESYYTWARAVIHEGFEETVKNRSFTFTVKRASQPLTPALAYWTGTDRCLTIFTGYVFLAAIGTIYLLRQEPVFSSPNLQKIEKSFTDFLKQAGGVCKVITIISIEMLAFPLYCGMLLDCALLPLFENTSFGSRLGFATQSPWLFAFLHWFIGTCYMFHFALFVSMCRRVMRNGVLYFIRDPDDPTFHPVRDVLERSVTTQLRKIAFSALVYGGLVIVCLGGVVWGTAHTFPGIFPVRWVRPESVLEFPIDFLLYNSFAPFVAKYLLPSRRMEKLFGRWLKLCARSLRLSHFLFGRRRKVEEGRVVGESLFSKLNPYKEERSYTGSEGFVKDGKYVRAPGSDQVRIPKGERVFLEVTEDNKQIEGGPDPDSGVRGRQKQKFTRVYIPPWFRLRIAGFIACLWVFAAATGLTIGVLPMVCGRVILALTLPQHVAMNDLYAFSVGLITLGSVLVAFVKGRSGYKRASKRASKQSLISLGAMIKSAAARLFKSAYVYGFSVIVVPTLFALVLQLYLILPLHTYMGPAGVSRGVSDISSQAGVNTTMSGMSEAQDTSAGIASHTIHVLQNWTLGAVYGRVVLRVVVWSRNSRPATALRMITRDGITNPNAKLATRAYVIPMLLLFSIVLLCPPLLASVVDKTVLSGLSGSMSNSVRTKVYRYSYPVCASQALGVWCVWELAKATKRWRGRIKDEVYLIGERLHNFGERKPPEGSRSVVRRQSW